MRGLAVLHKNASFSRIFWLITLEHYGFMSYQSQQKPKAKVSCAKFHSLPLVGWDLSDAFSAARQGEHRCKHISRPVLVQVQGGILPCSMLWGQKLSRALHPLQLWIPTGRAPSASCAIPCGFRHGCYYQLCRRYSIFTVFSGFFFNFRCSGLIMVEFVEKHV